MEQIKQLEGIYEKIQKVEQEIKEKTERRDEFFVQHEDERLSKIKEQLNKYVALLNSTIPLRKIKELIGQCGISSEKQGRAYCMRLTLDFSDGRLMFYFRQNQIGYSYHEYSLTITKDGSLSEGKCTLSCKKYAEVFQDTEPEVFIDLLKDIVGTIIQRLEDKLDKLQQQAADIFVPDTYTSDNIEKQQKIIIGQFQNYKVVLEKEEL